MADEKDPSYWDRAKEVWDKLYNVREHMNRDTFNYAVNKGMDVDQALAAVNRLNSKMDRSNIIYGGASNLIGGAQLADLGYGLARDAAASDATEGAYLPDLGSGSSSEYAARAKGGRLLQDQYPTHYMPHVGRQVMQEGGTPEDPVNRAMAAVPFGVNPVSLARRVVSESPQMRQSFEEMNKPGVVVSPKPGKGEKEEPSYRRVGSEFQPIPHWDYTTPDLIGMPEPPPFQHPIQNTPRYDKIAKTSAKIFNSKGFRDLIRDEVGLEGVTVKPTMGTWMGELEPSFLLQHPNMTPEQAKKLAHILGFGFQQDAVVVHHHHPDTESGFANLLVGHGNKLSTNDINNLHDESKKHGLDFTITGDGKAARFTHYGDESGLDDFLDKANAVGDALKMQERHGAISSGDLDYAEKYFPTIFGAGAGETGDKNGPARSPDLFRRIVDHVLTPYAKSVASEGYRLSPERLQKAYGLTKEETDHVRQSLLPSGKKSEDRSTVPLMEGDETLDIRPTGKSGQPVVSDMLYALQNRAARYGQINPGDYSDKAKSIIADDMAREVKHHVVNSDKSAIGWYDEALKNAMNIYGSHFDELKTDPEKRAIFNVLLGITSQGNDVYANSIYAARLHDLMNSQGKTLPEAVKALTGTFGSKTRAIENNLLKYHSLLEQNGHDRLQDLFNQTKTVSEWKKIFKQDPKLRIAGQGLEDQFKGGKDQKITGWMVFGPKIGSFINNLNGDYSTLTADLWFSRTWNRLLGHNFIHTPITEAKQYRDLRDAMKAEWNHHDLGEYAGKQPKIVDGKLKEGQAWKYGEDLKGMPKEEFDALLNDPEKMLDFATDLEEKYRKGQYKVKSDVRSRAKNWIENRENSQEAPRSNLERDFQQRTAEEAQQILKRKYNLNIDVADIQAALWFHEKELFGKHGVASEKAQPADYADAAAKTVELIKQGKLYDTYEKKKKTKAKAKTTQPLPEEPPPTMAEGGTVHEPHKRAEEQGYSIKGYHVTRGPRAKGISSSGRFSLEHAENPGEEAIFFWDNPEAANDWAHALTQTTTFNPDKMTERDKDRFERHQTSILPVRINPGNHAEVDWPSFAGTHNYNTDAMSKLISHAQDQNIDTLRIKNMQEDEYKENPPDQIAVLNPRLIRSEYAKFDPARQHENDIGAATGGEVN